MAVDRVRDNPIRVKIILDTNALFIPFKFKINLDFEFQRLFGDFEVLVPSCVMHEIERLAPSEKFGAKALALARSKVLPDWYLAVESELFSGEEVAFFGDMTDLGRIDGMILRIAKAVSGVVLTNDRAFLEKLKAEGVKTLSVRAKKYLILNGEY